MPVNSSDQTYVRFIILRMHHNSGAREGIFRVAYELRDAATTPSYDNERLSALISWFKSNLSTPDRFSRYNPKRYREKPRRGISWFKDSATEHIAKMRDLIAILEDYGYPIEQIRTNRPGSIVYDDEFQIVAEPFSSKT
jgi:hypothetical protein